MPAVNAPVVRCLRQLPEGLQDRPPPQPGTLEADEHPPHAEMVLLCRDCRHLITRPADRISVQGNHAHTFANPHGIVFEIGCFQGAPGCGAIGPASDEFTWFSGYRWRVCICAACLVHLGWVFLPESGAGFYGLILERLVESLP